MSHDQEKKPTTYREIAEVARVSNFAVSCAMRNRPGVSAKTRELILSVAQQLGYVPNPMVTALMEHQRRQRKGKCRAIIAYLRNFGPIVEDEFLLRKKPHSTHSTPFQGAKEMSEQQGFILELFPFRDFENNPQSFFRQLQARSVSAIIVHSERFPENWKAMPDWGNYTLVSAGGPHPDLQCDYACGDNHWNMWTLLSNLSRYGYKKTGLVLLENESSGWMEYDRFRHLSSFCGWHNKNGHPQPSVLVTKEWSRLQFLQWLKQERLDSIVAIDKTPLQILRESNIKVPEDIGFAHLDVDKDWNDVAGIYTNNYIVGATAAQLVIEQINRNVRGIPVVPRAFYLPGEWRSGQTIRTI